MYSARYIFQTWHCFGVTFLTLTSLESVKADTSVPLDTSNVLEHLIRVGANPHS